MIETLPLVTVAPVAKNYQTSSRADNRITEDIAKRFIAALSALESAGEVAPLVALFAEDCCLSNVVLSRQFHGRPEARRFWTMYRSAFTDIRSVFQDEIYTGNRARLEWSSGGKSRTGRKIRYEGVTVLEIAGEKILHLYACFDEESFSGLR